MHRFIATLICSLSLGFGFLPTIVQAAPALDYDLPAGHFYTQANGSALGAQGGGFAITDTDGVPFWTFFSEHGGVDLLGYPISRRFVWDGFVCQATQRAVLQWNPATKQVQLVNVFDYLSQAGKDSWLAAAHLAPEPERTPDENQPLSFLWLAHYRFAWLYHDPAIFHRYFSTPDYFQLYGLPTSPVEDMGPYYAARFQRVVIYHWKFPVPWADDRGVSVGLAGDLLKEVGLIPAAATRPMVRPDDLSLTRDLPAMSSPRTVPLMASSLQTVHPSPTPAGPTRPATGPASPVTGPVLVGVATWYGGGFQGLPMSNGRPYNMWNPSIAAANVYPLGTLIRVTRLTTGTSIVVEVTDRGAFAYPNVADLSYAAFAQLADPAVGVIGVRIEPVGHV